MLADSSLALLPGKCKLDHTRIQLVTKQSSANDGYWPVGGERERQLVGGQTRTAGSRRGDRKQQDPQSTHCRLSPSLIQGGKAAGHPTTWPGVPTPADSG